MKSFCEFAQRHPLPRWVQRLPEFLGSSRAGQRIRALLGPPPKGRELEVACYTGILISLLFLIATAWGKGGFLGWRAGQDFAAFYDAGTILNRGMAGQLYDLNLQTALYRELSPSAGATSLFPNAPWFALLFRPFAFLSFRWAYAAWVCVSIALYLSGIALLWPAALDPAARRTAFLAAVSFHPFVLETLVSGQVTAVAFFCIAAATRLLRQGRSFAAGGLLSGCLYKPTMLVLILPMLVVSRRWKALAGIAAGALGLASISILCVAPSSLIFYWRLMGEYRAMTAAHQAAFLAWEKFIDGYHFFRLLPGGGSVAMMVVAAAIAGFLLSLLVPAWLQSGRGPAFRNATWGATITFSLILNLHSQHYDAILLVIALLVSAESLAHHPDATLRSAYFRMCVLLWALPWVSQFVTRASHVQVFSLAIVLLGLLQIATVRRLATNTQRLSTTESAHRTNTTATSSS